MKVSFGAINSLGHVRFDLDNSDLDLLVSKCLRKVKKLSISGKENSRKMSRESIEQNCGYETDDEGSRTKGSRTEDLRAKGLEVGKFICKKELSRGRAGKAPREVSKEILVKMSSLKLDSSKKGSERLGFDQVGDCSDKEKDRKDLVCLEGAFESQKSSGSLDDQPRIEKDCSQENQPPSATVQSSDVRSVDASLSSDESDDELSGILDEFDNDISANLKNENEKPDRSGRIDVDAVYTVLERMSLADQPS